MANKSTDFSGGGGGGVGSQHSRQQSSPFMSAMERDYQEEHIVEDAPLLSTYDREQDLRTLGYMTGLMGLIRVFSLTFCSLIIAVIYCSLFFALYPFQWIAHDLFWKAEGKMFEYCLATITLWMYTSNLTIVESGLENANFHDKALVICNHQETGDIPVIMYCKVGHGIAGTMMWVIDSLFRWTNFGWVCACHGDIFLAEGQKYREQAMVALKKGLKHFSELNRQHLFLFPEGGLLWKRKEAGHRYARRNNLPILHHVALPRFGAFQMCMNELKGEITHVLDMTIGYPEALCYTVPQLIFGNYRFKRIYVHYRSYPISEIPDGERERENWLNDRFIEKEELLRNFYDTGSFVSEDDSDRAIPPRELTPKLSYLICTQIFWGVAGLAVFIPAIWLLHFILSFIF